MRYRVASVNPYCTHEAFAATIHEARALALLTEGTPGVAVDIRPAKLPKLLTTKRRRTRASDDGQR
jgi:hypothetical protein